MTVNEIVIVVFGAWVMVILAATAALVFDGLSYWCAKTIEAWVISIKRMWR